MNHDNNRVSMGNDILVVGGEYSGKLVLFGGQLHYYEKQPSYLTTSHVSAPGRESGAERYYEALVENMFSQNKYPDHALEAPIHTLNIRSRSHGLGSDNVSVIKLEPPHHGMLWNDTHRKPLLARISDGQVDAEDTIRERFKSVLQPYSAVDPPLNIDDWETIFLYHWYNSDKVLFLLNVSKIIDMDVPELVFSEEDINHAKSDFSRVAVIPTAVDRFGYDPDSYDRGLIESVIASLRGRRYRDIELLDDLTEYIPNQSVAVQEILRHVVTDPTVDCFSVAVPDNGSPQTQTGYLTPDGSGGFLVRGFDTLSSWLME